MVLGTASDVGKSLIVTALCRQLANAGVRVAPFKAQNMSLNSAATPEGLEIGRAQALQAEAARIVPSADMNPVLLKPTSDTGSQAIVQGRVWGNIAADDYGGKTREWFWPAVLASYERLATRYDVIVIEGAGSPAEINLRDGDIVNMAMAHAADARCLLIGDIDRGGVFASVYGTLALLDRADRARIDAFAINKFRGSVDLLQPGIAAIEKRTGVPCAGVIPYLRAIGLEEEDSLALQRRTYEPWTAHRRDTRLRMAIVSVPHLANFTDFDALSEEPAVDLRYTESPDDLRRADVIVLPGTKDTISDLRWLRERGLDRALCVAATSRIVLGICGGLQMLGRRIDDPAGIESGGTSIGLELLDLTTEFVGEKITVPVNGRATVPESAICGYEIHVGRTTYSDGLRPFAAIRRHGESLARRDGAISADGRIMGTYLHGIFARDEFRHAFVAYARNARGLERSDTVIYAHREREQRLNRLGQSVGDALDLSRLLPELARRA